MIKHKYSPCFNCYKYYYDSCTRICFASFPCKHLAEQYLDFYSEFYYSDDDSPIAFYVKKESVSKFENF